jgi:alpha-L-fucosidase 2
LADLVARQTCPNLFSMCFSAPQVEGAFGASAAIAELLLHSHAGEIVLLPALPKAWSTGSVNGLRVHGGWFRGGHHMAGRKTRQRQPPEHLRHFQQGPMWRDGG